MIGQRIIGNRGKAFTIARELGRGGFGTVYLAEDEARQHYAVKILSPVSDPAVKLSFEQEISSTVGLVHENLLVIADYGRCLVAGEEGVFAVSEYCEGGDYRRILKRYAQHFPGFDQIIQDIRQVLSGLGMLHSRIIHRDLKPENILISDGKLKLGDFGLAKYVDEATRTLTFKGGGTPLYMAPEVWQGKRTTPATDLYALGIIFFEAITGRPPFSEPDLDALRKKHLFDQPPLPSSINKDVPVVMDGVIRKLLAKDSKDRYQTAGEVLETFTDVSAPREPAIERLAAQARQHHDKDEAERLEQARARQAEEEDVALNKYKEQEILELIDGIIKEMNTLLPDAKIQSSANRSERDYDFGGRTLRVRFFERQELYQDPIVPGRMQILEKRHVVHGGYIEISEGSEDREGWNLVLVRPPESVYGEWRIVETRLSPLVAQRAKYEPFASVARLFADNLACHWAPMVHVYNLQDKPLQRDDLLRIVEAFIPKTLGGR